MSFIYEDFKRLYQKYTIELKNAIELDDYEVAKNIEIKVIQTLIEIIERAPQKDKSAYLFKLQQHTQNLEHLNKLVSKSESKTKINAFDLFEIIKDNHKEPIKEIESEQREINLVEPYTYKWDDVPSISFNDIAGLNQVKESVVQKVLLPLMRPDLYEGYDKKNGGGILLYGLPGTGKTMIAAAIAHEVKAKFCTITSADLLSTGMGNSERAVRQLFEEARSFKCAIIFFDEIESIAPKKTASIFVKQFRSEFLRQFQGMDYYLDKEKNQILLIVGATNKPWEIDTAFLRSGRFDTKFYVDIPDEEARWFIVNKKLNKIKNKGLVYISDDINREEIMTFTTGFNGADVDHFMNLVEEASIQESLTTQKKEIAMRHFLLASQKTKSSVMSEDIKKLLDWESQFNK